MFRSKKALKDFTEKEIQGVIKLLRDTEMSLGDIAKRVGCVTVAVAEINDVNKIRDYFNPPNRNVWRVGQRTLGGKRYNT